MAKTENTSRQVADALQALIDVTGVQAPDYNSIAEAQAAGFFSVEAFGQRANVGRMKATSLLNAGVEAGTVEMAKVRTGTTPARYYRAVR